MPEKPLRVLSNELDDNGTRECMDFYNKQSIQNFVNHLIRNNCKDYDIDKIKKIYFSMEIEKDKWVELERKGNIATSVYVPSNYTGPIAVDATVCETTETPECENSDFLCAYCNGPFVPFDWQNDICDKCFYKKT